MKQMNSPRCRSRGIVLAVALTLASLLGFGALEATASLQDLAAAVHLGT
jgi:hypothetical protein